MSNYSEQELIEGCKAGDAHCQEQLYKLKYELFYRVCVRYTKCYADAEQLTNDGFIKVFNNIHKYEGRGSFEGWIRRIMVNTCLDHLKSKKVRENRQTIAPDDYTEHVFFNIPANIIDDIAYEDLLKIIQEVPPTSQAVFNMFVIEGYSHREIAKEMNISEGTSQWHVNNARKFLQEKIKMMNLEVK